MDESLRIAIADAVTLHEIGHGDPYRLSFAGEGKSGASFGRMQGDLSVEPRARTTLGRVLAAAQIDPQDITAILDALSGPLTANPLSAEEDALVEAALGAPQGRRLVDRMDAQILATLLDRVAACVAAAAGAQRRIDPAAIIYIALWINMSGPPTTLKRWLAGHAVRLGRDGKLLAAPGAVVTVSAIEQYMKATEYFSANPRNFASLQSAVSAGEARLA